MNKKYILVTGGLGYIGSNTIAVLKKSEFSIIILDNLSNSNKASLKNLRKILNKKIVFIKADVRSKKINNIFQRYKIYSVIHFAGLKSVKESEKRKKSYHDNNINGTKNLLNYMVKNGCYKIIFSSSACVYNEKSKSPLSENSSLRPKSYYGVTKLKIEKILKDYKKKYPKFSCIILRYFNPVGADKTNTLRDNPKKAENIIPNISNVIKGEKKVFNIFGNNYPTKDGTCMRDYIHVIDLASSHVKSLSLIKKNVFEIINVGTGKPYSVKDMLNCFNKYLKKPITYNFSKKRAGDVAICYSNTKKQGKILHFRPKYGLNDMVKSVIKSLKVKS
jgi:UDP-glucose 4-epimerase